MLAPDVHVLAQVPLDVVHVELGVPAEGLVSLPKVADNVVYLLLGPNTLLALLVETKFWETTCSFKSSFFCLFPPVELAVVVELGHDGDPALVGVILRQKLGKLRNKKTLCICHTFSWKIPFMGYYL